MQAPPANGPVTLGTCPSMGTRSEVGFNPAMLQKCAGTRMDPDRSLPIPAGERPAAIRAWLVERYGSWISYKPTSEPAAWPLWLAPLALLLIGGVLVRGRIRR